jgi:hypothetical protein
MFRNSTLTVYHESIERLRGNNGLNISHQIMAVTPTATALKNFVAYIRLSKPNKIAVQKMFTLTLRHFGLTMYIESQNRMIFLNAFSNNTLLPVNFYFILKLAFATFQPDEYNVTSTYLGFTEDNLFGSCYLGVAMSTQLILPYRF